MNSVSCRASPASVSFRSPPVAARCWAASITRSAGSSWSARSGRTVAASSSGMALSAAARMGSSCVCEIGKPGTLILPPAGYPSFGGYPVRSTRANPHPSAAWSGTLRPDMLFEIPSPGDPFLVDAGPFQARWYGLLLALGVLIAGWIARREFRRRNDRSRAGLHDRRVDGAARSGRRAPVPRGHRLGRASATTLRRCPQIWKGGLRICGAVLGGMLGAWIGCRRSQAAVLGGRRLHRARADPRPGAGPVGQLLQPGAVRRPQRPAVGGQDRQPGRLRTAPGATFHPTFLYESLWDLLVFFILWRFIKPLLEPRPRRHDLRALRVRSTRSAGSPSRRCASTPPTCSSASG